VTGVDVLEYTKATDTAGKHKQHRAYVRISDKPMNTTMATYAYNRYMYS
jgi:hypothetical protein